MPSNFCRVAKLQCVAFCRAAQCGRPLMIAATVLMFVSITIEVGHPLCALKKPIPDLLRRNCANGELLTGQYNRLSKPLSSPDTSAVQVCPQTAVPSSNSFFNTELLNFEKYACNFTSPNCLKFFYVPNCGWFLWLPGSLIYTCRLFSFQLRPPLCNPPFSRSKTFVTRSMRGLTQVFSLNSYYTTNSLLISLLKRSIARKRSKLKYFLICRPIGGAVFPFEQWSQLFWDILCSIKHKITMEQCNNSNNMDQGWEKSIIFLIDNYR